MQDTGTGGKKHWLFIWYLSVDMQNYILNSSVLLDECQSSLRTQTGNLVTVVTAQKDAQVNKLVEIKCKLKEHLNPLLHPLLYQYFI